MADKVKVIDAGMQAAITSKRAFASMLQGEFARHKAEVAAYSEFWAGKAHERFVDRYNTERHNSVYIPQVVECLERQADEMEKILLTKQANDVEMASHLN